MNKQKNENEKINPGAILEISGSYWKSCTLHAAVKLEVFTALGGVQLTSEKISRKLNADKRGLTMLLNALTAMGLLAKQNDHYSNTEFSTSFLSKDSPQYMGHIIMHHHHLVESWSQLDQAVKTGSPVRARGSQFNEEWRESFLMGMFNMAMMLAPRLVKKIDLSNCRHLLDLGGGPGTYAVHFCLENPGLNATVCDLPTSRPFAEKTISKFGLSDRIDFLGSDYLKNEIKGKYDAAWLSQILHGEGPEACQKIIRKAVLALEPRGMIIIHEFLLDDTMDGPLFPALFSLNMLVGTTNGQAYSQEQIMNMLAGAGVAGIQRIAVQMPNDSGVITGLVS